MPVALTLDLAEASGLSCGDGRHHTPSNPIGPGNLMASFSELAR
jgi:hypothetical protein